MPGRLRAIALVVVLSGAGVQALPRWWALVQDVSLHGFQARDAALAASYGSEVLRTAAEISLSAAPREPIGLMIPCGNEVIGIHLRLLVAPRPVVAIREGFPEACAAIARQRLSVVHALRCPGRDAFARVDAAGVCGDLRGLVESLGKIDEGIPVAVDVPEDGARLPVGPFVVQGWCQDLTGPWDEIRFFLDGIEVTPNVLERFPRPDVAAVLPHLGDASSAGYRAVLPAQTPGRRSLVVFFRLPDGRARRQGPIDLEYGR